MAAEVLSASPLGLGYVTNRNSAPTHTDEFAELEKIVRLRDDIYAGKHPRFKPLHTAGSTFSQKPQAVGAGTTVINSDKPQPSNPRVPPPVLNAPKHPVMGGRTADSQISDVLLTKSDVLIKAENNLKRDRIERELKQQLDNKLVEDRLKAEGREKDQNEDDLDVEKILAQAQSVVIPNLPQPSENAIAYRSGKKRSIDEANEDNMVIDQNFYDERPENLGESTEAQRRASINHNKMEAATQIPTRSVLPLRSEMVPSQDQEKTLNQWPGAVQTTSSLGDNGRGISPPQQISERLDETGRNSPAHSIRLGTQRDNPAVMRDASIRERPTQPSVQQQRRSSVAQVDDPMPPQPVRMITAASRHVPEDRVIDLRGEEVEQSPRDKPQLESRRSSNAYIKPEPGTRPSSVTRTIRRSPSLERIRVEPPPPLRRYYYDYSEAPRYSYPQHLDSPLPAHDPFYRGAAYAYPPPPPPPPLEYSARPYPRAYPPVYPVYDEYNRVYHLPPSRAVPTLPPSESLPRDATTRQQSQAPERRSPASPGPYRRRRSRENRRQSRSLSPRRDPEDNLIAVHPPDRLTSRAPSVAPGIWREVYERPMAPPPPPGHYIDPYHPGYYIPVAPERSVYYDGRAYYARPVSSYVAELPLPPREFRENSLAPHRVLVSPSLYRERDYPYPPPSLMAPPPRPYPAIEYRDYRPEVGREAEEAFVRRSLRVDERSDRAEEYIRGSSVRPELARHPAYGVPMPPPIPVMYAPSSARTEALPRGYVIAEEERYYHEPSRRLISDLPLPALSRAVSARPDPLRREYVQVEDERYRRDPVPVQEEAERGRRRSEYVSAEEERYLREPPSRREDLGPRPSRG